MNKKMYKLRDTQRAIAEGLEIAENHNPKSGYNSFEEFFVDFKRRFFGLKSRTRQRNKCVKLMKSI